MDNEIISEMKYGDANKEVLAKGTYKGIDFVVQNIRGMHPCGYVNVANTPFEGVEYRDDELNFVDCHGGLTYSASELRNCSDGWWIGWDYGHFGDRCCWESGMSSLDLINKKFGFLGDDIGDVGNGKEWTTSEVVDECKRVIDQIIQHSQSK